MEYHQTIIYSLRAKSSCLLLYPSRNLPPPLITHNPLPCTADHPSVSAPIFSSPTEYSQCFNSINSRTLQTPFTRSYYNLHFYSVPSMYILLLRILSSVPPSPHFELWKLVLKLIMLKIYFPCKIYSSCIQFLFLLLSPTLPKIRRAEVAYGNVIVHVPLLRVIYSSLYLLRSGTVSTEIMAALKQPQRHQDVWRGVVSFTLLPPCPQEWNPPISIR